MTWHLLIAEDDADLRTVFARAFQVRGFDVEVACDGQQALDKLGDGLPDVLIVDLGLPLVSGVEVVRRLRQLETQRRTRVVVVTGNHLYGSCEDANQADMILIKPVWPTHLVQLAERLTRNLDPVP